MKNKFTLSKISFWLFSITTAVLLFRMFPVVLCPFMWVLFLITILVQLVWHEKIFIFVRIWTTFIFLLIAYRIYNGYVTDFTISAPDSIGFKFILLATFYFGGTFILYVKSKQWVEKTLSCFSIMFALCMIMLGYYTLKEIHFESVVRFKRDNPDCIAVDNWNSKNYCDSIKILYTNLKKTDNESGMIYGTTRTSKGTYYTIVLCDGSVKDTPPLLQIEEMSADSIPLSNIMFRYDPVFRYGYFKYEMLQPKQRLILDKDSAETAFRGALKPLLLLKSL